MTDIAPPRFELYEVTSEDEFVEIFPLLNQLGHIETPETIESLTQQKSWAQYQSAMLQNYRLYMAKSTTEVLGVVGIRICDDPMNNGKPYALINNLIVEEDYRGLGIGTDILERSELVAKKHKCDLTILAILNGNKQAKKLYEDNGYSQVSQLMIKEI
jgi:ribosomal protein S18 acetylase RimI-like enzyme